MTRFAAYDGTQLAFSEVGEGEPLVCLPGGPGRAAEYLEDLGGTGRRLVRLDLRGSGRSDVPADPTTLRFDRMAADVEALREHLGLERLDLLGHSAGTVVAQAWAAQHPERVRSLVLLTPSGRLQGCDRPDLPQIRAARSAEPWYADALEAVQDLEGDARPSQRAALLKQTRPFWYGRWDARCQEHALSAEHQVSRRVELGFAADLDQVDVAGLLQGLRRVTAPVLVVGGERDALTGLAAVDAVAASFPDARTAVVPAAGHFPWVDEPEALASVLRPFLGTL